LFLELQRAHSGDRLEVMMKAGDAHPEFARYIVNLKRLIEVFAQSPDRPGYAAGVPGRSQQVAEPRALAPRQEPVSDLPDGERHQELAFARRVEQPNQSDDRVEHAGVD